MARAGRKDRGLVPVKDTQGKITGWRVRLWCDGKERRFGAFKTKTEAREFYEQSKQEQKQGRFFPELYRKRELVETVIDAYCLTLATKKAAKDERRYAWWWKERFHGLRLNAITPEALEQVQQDLLATGHLPGTCNRYLAWLRHVLNLAVRDKKLLSNPFLQVKMLKEPKGKTRFLSPAEEAALLAAMGPTHGPWARLAILTGMRQMEQFSLRWADVDLEMGIITLPTTKAGGVQYVHLNEEAKAILRGLDSWQRSVWVFPSKNPATHMDAINFYVRIWTPAVKATGIEWVSWHALRHTFASRLAMNGHNEGTIAALLRHSTTALVSRYAHLNQPHLKAALEGVAAFGKGSPAASSAQPKPDREGPGSSPTVPETGYASVPAGEEPAQVVERFGGPGEN